MRVCMLLALGGAGLNLLARLAGWPDAAELLKVPSGLSTDDLGVVVGAVALVTGARVALLAAWPEFKDATDASNGQVLPNLAAPDIVVVSVLPGLSEELLFRWGVLPLFPSPWLGALAAGALFGVLHNNGGRNPAFALWAGVVGVVYGGTLIITGNILVPAAAHSLSNLASAAYWRTSASKSQ